MALNGSSCATGTREAPSERWTPNTYTVTTDPVLVAQADATRRGVLVVCTSDSPGNCHVADKRNAKTAIGSRSYPLIPGEGITVNTAAEVYVIADDTVAGATVKVIEEFGSV